MFISFDQIEALNQSISNVCYHVHEALKDDLACSESHAIELVIKALNRVSVIDSIIDTSRTIEENANLTYTEIIHKILGGDDNA